MPKRYKSISKKWLNGQRLLMTLTPQIKQKSISPIEKSERCQSFEKIANSQIGWTYFMLRNYDCLLLFFMFLFTAISIILNWISHFNFDKSIIIGSLTIFIAPTTVRTLFSRLKMWFLKMEKLTLFMLYFRWTGCLSYSYHQHHH